MTWVHLGLPASVCFGSYSHRGKTQIWPEAQSRPHSLSPASWAHTCWVLLLFRYLQGLSVPLGPGWADKRGSLVSKRGRDQEPRRGWAPVLALTSWAVSSLDSPISKMGEFRCSSDTAARAPSPVLWNVWRSFEGRGVTFEGVTLPGHVVGCTTTPPRHPMLQGPLSGSLSSLFCWVQDVPVNI